MEPQTTPASPPKKVRRIGSATSLEGVLNTVISNIRMKVSRSLF